MPGLALTLHAAADWESDRAALEDAKTAIARADLVIVTMIFMEEHARAILPALAARREACDAMVCVMSAPEIARLTRMGRFDASAPASGALAILKKLRGKSSERGGSGAGQLKMLRACRRSCASCRAPPRTCAPISSPCNTGSPAATRTSRTSSA